MAIVTVGVDLAKNAERRGSESAWADLDGAKGRSSATTRPARLRAARRERHGCRATAPAQGDAHQVQRSCGLAATVHHRHGSLRRCALLGEAVCRPRRCRKTDSTNDWALQATASQNSAASARPTPRGRSWSRGPQPPRASFIRVRSPRRLHQWPVVVSPVRTLLAAQRSGQAIRWIPS